MAKKQDKDKKMPTAPSSARPRAGQPIHVWVPDELREALERLLERDRRTLTATMILILEKHLAEEGLWPPGG